MKATLHPDAEKDVAEAAEFYEREGSPALASRFIAEFKRVTQLLLSHPGLGSPRSNGRLAFPMRVFPSLVRPDDLRSFGHRSRTAADGLRPRADYAGKPVIAIINTWSDINPCHSHFRERAEDVKRGVWQAGGFPLEMPAISAVRAAPEADDDAVPQLPRDGDRGAAALLPGRRLRADGRLRQDHARRC
jgi:plasmid stabilization system protein ParE